MSPTDYSSGEIGSSLWPFFASVVGGYHGGGPHALHETNWTLPAGTGALAGLPADGVLDLRRYVKKKENISFGKRLRARAEGRAREKERQSTSHTLLSH